MIEDNFSKDANKDFPSITNTHLQQETAFPSKESVSDNTQQSIEEKESCLILTNSLSLSAANDHV